MLENIRNPDRYRKNYVPDALPDLPHEFEAEADAGALTLKPDAPPPGKNELREQTLEKVRAKILNTFDQSTPEQIATANKLSKLPLLSEVNQNPHDRVGNKFLDPIPKRKTPTKLKGFFRRFFN